MDIAATAGAKAEVLAHGHQLGLQLLHEHLLHKLLRAEGRQFRRKGHQHQLLDTERLQQMDLFGG